MKKSKRPSAQLITAAKNLLIAQAYTSTVKDVVVNYQTEILKTLNVTDDEGNIITEPRRAFRMSDDNFLTYAEKCEVAARAAGFKIDSGYCPLLIAEQKVREAETDLVDAANYLTNITKHQLLCAGLKTFKEFIDITLRFAGPYARV